MNPYQIDWAHYAALARQAAAEGSDPENRTAFLIPVFAFKKRSSGSAAEKRRACFRIRENPV